MGLLMAAQPCNRAHDKKALSRMVLRRFPVMPDSFRFSVPVRQRMRTAPALLRPWVIEREVAATLAICRVLTVVRESVEDSPRMRLATQKGVMRVRQGSASL